MVSDSLWDGVFFIVPHPPLDFDYLDMDLDSVEQWFSKYVDHTGGEWDNTLGVWIKC